MRHPPDVRSNDRAILIVDSWRSRQPATPKGRAAAPDRFTKGTVTKSTLRGQHNQASVLVPRTVSMTGLGDRRRLLLRAACLVAALLAIGGVIAGLSPRFDALRVPCSETLCAPQQLNPVEARKFEQAGLSLTDYAAIAVGLEAVAVLAWFALATLLFRSRQGGPVTLAVVLMLITFGATFSGFIEALEQQGTIWRVLVAVMNWLGLVSITGFMFLFPDGRFSPRQARMLLPLMAVAYAALYAYPDARLDPKTSLPGVAVVVLFLGAGVVTQIYRFRQESDAVERQQTKWVLAGACGLVGGFAGVLLLDVVNREIYDFSVAVYLTEIAAFNAVKLLLPLSIVVAILRYRLWDIDVLINRTLVYGALTTIIVGVYVLVVGYLGALFRTGSNLLVSLLATGLVAVLFQPIRERLQQSVNRLMYGERDDPYSVIAHLGQRLEAALTPETILPTIVTTIRDALRLPYAAIAVKREGDFHVAASAGDPVPNTLRLPLVHLGEPVGHLFVGPRSSDEPWAPADRRLLNDLARQAGTAVQGVQLTADLQRLTADLQQSRERLVLSREEERRRLRSDLHDDLAPTLAALSLTAATARDMVSRDPEAARELMTELHTAARAAVADIRRLVYDLRPPTLDELGLVAAIRERAAQYERHRAANAEPGAAAGLRVEVEAPDALPGIPAAVEVAAYRIVQESLANVVRHAHARTCTIRILPTQDEAGPHLLVEIIDDGIGLSPEVRRGVGLTSMRERAIELSGRLSVTPNSPTGTRVQARLPLAGEEGCP